MTKHLKASGIVVEYNPFHNGHIYHIQKTREITKCDVLIAIMSPHFVQRGEPAFVDKWERTHAALSHGVDIVIELPTFYALQSADYFAKAAVEGLALMHVDSLCFGSESADSNAILNQFQFKKDTTKSYAKQMADQSMPNDILAFHYIQTAQTLGIQTYPIQRTNAYHDSSAQDPISSASAIRKHYHLSDVSHTTPMALHSMTTFKLNEYEALIKYALHTHSKEALSAILLVDEGIENLLLKHANKPLEAMIDACISSRYTRSRITRTLMNIMLNIPKEDVKPMTQVRVLGMNATGRRYLKQIKNDAHYVTSFREYIHKDLELKATQVYSLVKSQEVQDTLQQMEIQTLIKM